MAQIRFDQIVYQVMKYAPTQLMNAAFARAKFMGLRRDLDGRYYARAQTWSTKIFDKRLGRFVSKPSYVKYDTFIMIHPYKTRRTTIVLSCSCPDFLYRHEVALYKRGGAEVEYSNGRLPKITNPRLRATCCKHCLRFYIDLSRRFPQLFAEQRDLEQAIGTNNS